MKNIYFIILTLMLFTPILDTLNAKDSQNKTIKKSFYQLSSGQKTTKASPLNI